jgi:hypothetical protein
MARLFGDDREVTVPLKDNVASAIDIAEGTNSYLKFRTTNGSESAVFGKIVELGAGASVADATNVALGTTTGTKIGTATAQKLGFWNATPVIQQAHSAQAAVTPSTDFTGTDQVNKATVLAAVQALQTLVNRLRLDLVTTGIIKGSA